MRYCMVGHKVAPHPDCHDVKHGSSAQHNQARTISVQPA